MGIIFSMPTIAISNLVVDGFQADLVLTATDHETVYINWGDGLVSYGDGAQSHVYTDAMVYSAIAFAVNAQGRVSDTIVIPVGVVAQPPTDWGPMTQDPIERLGDIRDIAIADNTILIGGYNGHTRVAVCSTDGGYNFSHVDTPVLENTSEAVAISSDLGWYIVTALRAVFISTSSPITGYTQVVDLAASLGTIKSIDIDDSTGRILLGGSYSHVAYKIAGDETAPWILKEMATTVVLNATKHIDGDEWICCGTSGVGYYTSNYFSTEPELLEPGLNCGNSTANIIDMSSHPSGFVIAVMQDGYASYSTNYGRPGSWLPISGDLGHGETANFFSVAVSKCGSYVVVGGISGVASLALVSDLNTWDLLPAGLNSGANEVIKGLAFDASGICVACLDSAYLAISPPLA